MEIFPIPKIKVDTPLVDIDGDEMTRVIWKYVREKIINKYLDIKLIYFDCSLENREKTDDKIVKEAIEAIKKYEVAIKCATITADETRVIEFNLKRKYTSPNVTIRHEINGVFFREPIIIENITPYIPNWKNPIIIGRHAFGDQYYATELKIKNAKKLKIVYEDDEGTKEIEVFDLNKNKIKDINTDIDKDIHKDIDKDINYDDNNITSKDTIAMLMYNTDESIFSFAHVCFKYAIDRKYPLYLSTKNTINQIYDQRFKSIFDDLFENEYKKDFEKLNIFYEHKLIDDMVAFSIKSSGGYIWATKNYDGDVQSDFVCQGFGSLGIMSSILLSPKGYVLTEVGHGTATRHYRIHKNGGKTSTNSISCIFAWSKALFYRAKKDNNKKLLKFVEILENSTKETVIKGFMTKDLAICVNKKKNISEINHLSTEEFIDKVCEFLHKNFIGYITSNGNFDKNKDTNNKDSE